MREDLAARTSLGPTRQNRGLASLRCLGMRPCSVSAVRELSLLGSCSAKGAKPPKPPDFVRIWAPCSPARRWSRTSAQPRRADYRAATSLAWGSLFWLAATWNEAVAQPQQERQHDDGAAGQIHWPRVNPRSVGTPPRPVGEQQHERAEGDQSCSGRAGASLSPALDGIPCSIRLDSLAISEALPIDNGPDGVRVCSAYAFAWRRRPRRCCIRPSISTPSAATGASSRSAATAGQHVLHSGFAPDAAVSR